MKTDELGDGGEEQYNIFLSQLDQIDRESNSLFRIGRVHTLNEFADWCELHNRGSAARALRWASYWGLRPLWEPSQPIGGDFSWSRRGPEPSLFSFHDLPPLLLNDLWYRPVAAWGMGAYKIVFVTSLEAWTSYLLGWDHLERELPKYFKEHLQTMIHNYEEDHHYRYLALKLTEEQRKEWLHPLDGHDNE